MTNKTLNNVAKEKIFERLDDVQSQLGVWRDTLLSMPPSTQVTLTAGELANVLSRYYEQINAAKTKL